MTADNNAVVKWQGLKEASQALSAPSLKKLRSELLKGEHPSNCSSCWDAEASGAKSFRQICNERFGDVLDRERAEDLTLADGSLRNEPVLHFVDFRPSNYCNLKCRMCGPAYSTAWYGDFRALGFSTFSHWGETFRIDSIESDDPFGWGTLEESWDKLLDVARVANRQDAKVQINFAGGEPLINPRHLNFLRTAIQQGLAPSIRLYYSTNLTQLSDEVITAWESFDSVNVGISLDGVGPINDYIRYPGGFNKVETNLEKLSRSLINDYWIQTSVSVLNAWHLPDLIAWVLQKNLQLSRPIRLAPHLVFYPAHYHLSVLPPRVRPWVVDRLTTSLELPNKTPGPIPDSWRKDFDSTYGPFLKGLINQLNDSASPLWGRFCEYTRALDRLRTVDFERALEPFASALKSSGGIELPFDNLVSEVRPTSI